MISDADVKRPHPAVFLQDFVDVQLPLESVASLLVLGGEWLGAVAGAAGDDARTLLVRIGPSRVSESVARDVVVRLGEPIRHGASVVVPLRWEAVRRPGLFPVLDGDLEVVPLGADQCRIVLHASYRPPLERVGLWIDRALLHRVAESTVRCFLLRVAGEIERELTGRPETGVSPDGLPGSP